MNIVLRAPHFHPSDNAYIHSTYLLGTDKVTVQHRNTAVIYRKSLFQSPYPITNKTIIHIVTGLFCKTYHFSHSSIITLPKKTLMLFCQYVFNLISLQHRKHIQSRWKTNTIWLNLKVKQTNQIRHVRLR